MQKSKLSGPTGCKAVASSLLYHPAGFSVFVIFACFSHALSGGKMGFNSENEKVTSLYAEGFLKRQTMQVACFICFQDLLGPQLFSMFYHRWL